MTTTIATTLDVRQIAHRDRHAQIFGRFDALKPGEALLLVNDHDPLPLRYQFEDRAVGQFDWTYLESGPALWRVQIGKLKTGAAIAAGDSCCSGGACCG
jgi:uncharacterized protein (DUF2249 family)